MPLFGPPNIEKLLAKKNVRGLIRAMGYKKDTDVRCQAAAALGKIGDPSAVEPLIAALKVENWRLNRAAAKALGWIGDARAVDPLIELLGSYDSSIKNAAVNALASIGRPAIPTLVAELSRYYSEGAAAALNLMGWTPGQDEVGTWYWASRGEFEKCVAIGAPAVVPLADFLEHLGKEIGVRKAAAEALGAIGDPHGVEPLIAALQNPRQDNDVRWAAAEALGEIGDPRAADLLIAALGDEGIMVDYAAEQALKQISAPVVPSLLPLLRDEGSKKRQKTAFKLMGEIGDEQAMAPLVATLADKSDAVREAAVKALDDLGWAPTSDKTGAWYWMTKREWEKCAAIGAQAVEPLVSAVLVENSVRRRRPENRFDRRLPRPTQANRVGGGLTAPVLPHHQAYGSVPGGFFYGCNLTYLWKRLTSPRESNHALFIA